MPTSEYESGAFSIEKHEASPEPSLEELLSVSPEFEATYRPKLQQDLREMLGTLADPIIKAQCEVIAGIHDWMLFGKPGEPLPRGLVAAQNRFGEIGLTLDSRLACWTDRPEKCWDDMGSRFESQDEIHRALGVELEQKRPHLQKVLPKRLQETAEFQFVNALSMPVIAEPLPRPLSSFKKAALMAQAEQTVRSEYGLSREEPLHFGTLASRALARQMREIDESSEPNESESLHQGVVESARAFFLPYIKKALLILYPACRYESIEYYTDIGDTMIIAKKHGQDEEEILLYDVAPLAATQFARDIGQLSKYWDPKIGRAFLREFLAELYDNYHDRTYDEIVEASMDRWVDITVRRVGYPLMNDYEEVSTRWPLLSGVRKPSGVKVGLELLDNIDFNLERQSDRYMLSSTTGFKSAEQIALEKNETQGAITELHPDVTMAHRLVLFQPMPLEISSTMPKRGLKLHMLDISKAMAPHIPGTKLIARNADTFCFVPDQAGEPYTPCETLIPPHKKSELAQVYRSIGLWQLADMVDGQGALTVEGLRGLVWFFSTYVLPEEESPFFLFKSFEDFIPFVDDEQLLVQCSISDKFLSMGLAAAFGKSRVGNITGYVFDDSRITRAIHVQTTFISDDDRLHILDATPSIMTYNNSSLQPIDNSEPPARKAPLVSKIGAGRFGFVGEAGEVIPHASKEILHAERHEAIIKGFEHQLMALFQCQTLPQLQDKLVRLPSGDPIRKTIEAVYALRQQVFGERSLEATVNYLDVYAAANSEARQKAGIADYDNAIIMHMRHVMALLLRHW